MKYDDVDWHYGQGFPHYLNDAAAVTHMGMYVAWCFLNEMANDEFIDTQREDYNALISKSMTPGKWFFECCGEKLFDDLFNDRGNDFSEYFYASSLAPFWSVYDAALGQNVESLYAVSDTWESYDKLAAKMSTAFQLWAQRGAENDYDLQFKIFKAINSQV